MKLLVSLVVTALVCVLCINRSDAADAFSVQRGQAFVAGPPGFLRRIRYTGVVIDTAGAYSVPWRHYKIPVSGVWTFTISAAPRSPFIGMVLVSQQKGRLVAAYSRDIWTQASNTVTVRLARDDRLWVYLIGTGMRLRASGPPSTTFSGHRIA